jgi:hypothetical protein
MRWSILALHLTNLEKEVPLHKVYTEGQHGAEVFHDWFGSLHGLALFLTLPAITKHHSRSNDPEMDSFRASTIDVSFNL